MPSVPRRKTLPGECGDSEFDILDGDTDARAVNVGAHFRFRRQLSDCRLLTYCLLTVNY